MSLSKLEKRKLLLGATMISFSVAAAFPMYAQDDTEDETVEEIVVTGIRASIRNALELKREETSIVEAISAEDIGKLPDFSIAESIARLPGLAAQRTNGRAQSISVRGLGPDFTTALLNGREQVTAGDSRGVEFDQYPSEILSSAVIYKTPDAGLIGQGLGGTVDLRTIRPLEYGKSSLTGSARYEWNDQGKLNAGTEDSGYRLTSTYIDQFANDTIGVLLGVTTQSSPNQAERWDSWGYPDANPDPDIEELVIGGAKPYVESRELERNAIIGTIEYAPNDKFSASTDMLYSEFKDTGILRGIEFPLLWSGSTLVDPGYTVENGLITQGVFTGVQGVVRNDARDREAEVYAFGVNADYQINDDWSVNGDYSYSKVDRIDTDLETYAGTGSGFGTGASDTLGFSISEGGSFVFDSVLDYADPSLMLLTDPQGWGQVGFIKSPTTEDELNALRLTAERFVGGDIFDNIEFGVNFTTRDKAKRAAESFIDLANPGITNTAAIPAEFLLNPTALDFLGIPGMVSYDPVALFNSGIYTLRPDDNPVVITKRWDVSEDVTTGYVQFNVDTVVNGNTPIRGNFGVQVVQTDQSSTGPSVQDGAFVDITRGTDYTDILPSANFSVELNEDSFIRLSAAKTLMRARLDDLRASREINTNDNICTFVGGVPVFDGVLHNPAEGQSCIGLSGGFSELNPYTSSGFDIAYEKYFADGAGYVSVATFYKELEDFIIKNDTRVVDVTEEANAIFGSAFVAANPEIATGTFSAPINADGGRVSGFELATSLVGEMFSDNLDGFGLQASYAFTDSKLIPKSGEPETDVPGLSRDVFNASVYYEDYGFQARLSARKRTRFLGELEGIGIRDFRDVEPETVLDAQIGYSFESGTLEGTTVLLQAYNLTDEPFGTSLNSDPRQVKDFQSYGTSFLLALNYKF